MAVSNTSPNADNYYIGKGIVWWKAEGDTDYRQLGNVPEFEYTPSVEKLDHFSSQAGVKVKDRTVVTQKSATVRIVMEEWTQDNLALFLLGATADAVTLNTTGDTHSSTTLDNIASLAGLAKGATAYVAGEGIPDGASFTVPASGASATLSKAATATASDVALTITQPATIDIFANSDARGALRFEGTNDVGPRVTLEFPSVSFTPSSSINPITDEWGQIEVTGDVNAVAGKFGTAYWNTGAVAA